VGLFLAVSAFRNVIHEKLRKPAPTICFLMASSVRRVHLTQTWIITPMR